MYELRVAAHTYFLLYGLLSCLTVDGSRGNSRHCRSGVRPRHVLGVNRLGETSGEICDATTEAKQVHLYRVSGNEANLPQIKIVLTTPADVSRVVITFSGTIHDVSSGTTPVSLLSCAGKNDTLLIRQHAKNTTACVHIVLSLHSTISDIGRLWVKRNGKMRGMRIKLNVKDVHYNDRFKRSKSEGLAKTQYGNSSESGQITDISECGKTRSCFRYHKTNSGCGHLECSYFLSYSYKHTMEQTEYEFDVELSGHTDGWLAVGFSSDQQMLGDALVCRSTVSKPDITVGAYQIRMRHSHPTPKDGFRANLLAGRKQNGFMYCRFQFRSDQDQIMEMTNDWFQLYARGPISLTTVEGDLGKHQERPLMSDYKISLIKSVNKMNVYTSKAPHVTFGFMLLFLNWALVSLLRFFI